MECITCGRNIEDKFGEGQCYNCWWSIGKYNGSQNDRSREE